MDDRLSPNSLFFSWEVNVPLCSRVRVKTELCVTSSEVFGTSSDIFGYFRTPTKNLGTLKIKNVTPINVERLAGIIVSESKTGR